MTLCITDVRVQKLVMYSIDALRLRSVVRIPDYRGVRISGVMISKGICSGQQ